MNSLRALFSALLFAGCSASSSAERRAAVEWPRFGPASDSLELRGHVNALPDFVGPIDGSAKLTIFTEGNHFPVLLPLVFDEFPEWCDSR
ncbi:MAG: hypothetical protein AAF658_02230, partial [Myxococcota bacterium]